MLSILGEKLRWRKRNKTVTKTTHKYRQNHWGFELKPQLHMRRRVLPLHLRRVTESPPSPRKFSMNIQANTDFRSYQYAMGRSDVQILNKVSDYFFMFPAACSFLNKVHIFLWYSVEGLPSSPWKSHFFLLSPFCPYDTWNLKNKINAPLHRALTWMSAETIIVCFRIKENYHCVLQN